MSETANANGKRPIEDYELLIGLAKEADVIAEHAKKVAKRNEELATDIVKAAKETNSLAREAEFNAVQAWDKAKKATPSGVDFEALMKQRAEPTKIIKRREAEPGSDPAVEEAIQMAEKEAIDAAVKEAKDAEAAGEFTDDAAAAGVEPATFEYTAFPNDGNPTNFELEELFRGGMFKFVSGTYAATGQTEQCIVPGPNGRRNDIFEQKELFKRCTPRFFFNGEHKQWRRVAPEGWEPAA